MSDVTRILSAIERGDPKAAEQLLPLVYEELRKLAAEKMAAEKPGQTLQATALVHEAYVRLVQSEPRGLSPRGVLDHGDKPRGSPEFANRRHFFAAAAEAMRRILIDSARRKRTAKHGGQGQRVNLDALDIAAESASGDVLAIDEALTKLAAEDPVKAQLVTLRYFAGLSVQEAADALDISRATADRYWAYARTWLYCELGGNERGPGVNKNSPGA